MSFTYTEPIAARYLGSIPDNLNVQKTTFPEPLLIRLLLGSLDFTLDHENISIRQRTNYSNTLGVNNRILSSRIIRLTNPLAIEDLDDYLTKFKNANYNLFQDLLFEFSPYFVNKRKETI